MKNVLTLTLIAGTRSCPNDCPICISKMTPSNGIEKEKIPVDVPILRKSIQFALNHKAQNILITGKGEPTLYPAQVSQYLTELKGLPFDKREIQTEGSNLNKDHMMPWLEAWRYLDLDFVAISMYHYDMELNDRMFNGGHHNISTLCQKLNYFGYRVRLSCILAKGCIDNVGKVKNLLEYAKTCGAVQLTLRDMGMPFNPLDKIAAENVEQFRLEKDERYEIIRYIQTGQKCDVLPHGAEIWEIDGQNVCITTCLSEDDAGKDDIRHLVFFPQGILTSSWVTIDGSRIF